MKVIYLLFCFVFFSNCSRLVDCSDNLTPILNTFAYQDGDIVAFLNDSNQTKHDTIQISITDLGQYYTGGYSSADQECSGTLIFKYKDFEFNFYQKYNAETIERDNHVDFSLNFIGGKIGNVKKRIKYLYNNEEIYCVRIQDTSSYDLNPKIKYFHEIIYSDDDYRIFEYKIVENGDTTTWKLK